MKVKWQKAYNDFTKEYRYSFALYFLGIVGDVERIDKHSYESKSHPENIGKWKCCVSADICLSQDYQLLEKLHNTPEEAQQNAVEVAKKIVNDQIKQAKEELKQLERIK